MLKQRVKWVFVCVLLIYLLKVSSALVSLTANYSGNACPNETVTLTCITNTGRLAWVNPGDNHLFQNSDPIGSSQTFGRFTITLTSTVSSSFTSIATISTTVNNNGSTITCRDGATMNSNAIQRTVIIATVPSVPMNFINTTNTYNSVFLSWSPPSFLSEVPIDQYQISISPDPTNGPCTDGQCLVLGNDTTITNLQYGVEHEIDIVAINCAGKSDPATLSFTIVAEVEDPPTDLDICMTGQEIRVSWNCPNSTSILSPPIMNYIATISRYDSPDVITLSVSHTGCDCLYTIYVPVQAASLYIVRIASNNTVGLSQNNPMMEIYTSPNMTYEPTMLTTTTALLSVKVSWTTCTGTLADLRVMYTLGGSNITTLSIPVTLPLRTNSYIPLSSLETDTTYSLSFALLTEEGSSTGPPVSGFSFQTDKEIPPIQCSSVVLTVTDTVVSTVINTVTPSPGTGQQQQCANEGTLLLGVGALGAIVVIVIIVIVCLFIYILFTKIRGSKRTGELVDNTNDKGMSMMHMMSGNSLANSSVHLIPTSPFDIPHDHIDMMTPNDSYGHRPPAPLPTNDQMYAEVAPRPLVTENPTYIESTTAPVPIPTEPLYIEDEKVEASIKSLSPPSSPTHDGLNNDDLTRPNYNKTDSVYLEMSSALKPLDNPPPLSNTELNVYNT